MREKPMERELTPVEWLQALFQKAIYMGVSDVFLDVHVLPDGNVSKVEAQLRIDNELIDAEPIEGKRAFEVSNLIRQRSSIGTGELIEPKEGRYPHDHEVRDSDGVLSRKEALDVRITMYPVGVSQFISMRIPPVGALRPLEELGFSKYNYDRLMRLLAKPGGLTLLAGPMGSGKTTTLYAATMKMGGRRKSVITVEDPKERTLAGARQLEINPGGDGEGMTYAKVLKSLLRVVMDVLLIGEIRDSETAEAAIRIATAGARVLSSIHADDPVTAIAKVISYTGQSPVNVLSGISGVASQRMIRLLCKTCRGEGCSDCSGIGFRGKAPLHEVLINTPAITEAFINNWRYAEIAGLARYEGMTSFHQNADRFLNEGLTTEREVENIIGFDLRKNVVKAPAQPVQRPQQAPSGIDQALAQGRASESALHPAQPQQRSA